MDDLDRRNKLERLRDVGNLTVFDVGVLGHAKAISSKEATVLAGDQVLC